MAWIANRPMPSGDEGTLTAFNRLAKVQKGQTTWWLRITRHVAG